MKRAVILFGLAGALMASAAVNVYHAVRASPASRYTSDATVKRVCPSLEELGLSPGQRDKLSGCCGQCGTWRKQLQQKTDALITELERELNATPLNQERVFQLADEIGELRAQELKSRVHSIVQVRETLTASQLERLVSAVKEPFTVPDGTKEKGE